MREKLIQYVELLFTGIPDSEEIKQEILQNTLDRYDDLIEQGKTPEAAYRLAITGIGDINEIIADAGTPASTNEVQHPVPQECDTILKQIMRAAAIALYILCPIPLFVLTEFGMETFGLCGTLAIVAVATVLILLGKKPGSDDDDDDEPEPIRTPQQRLHNSISNVIWSVGVVLYFIISFTTGAWYITWVIFPILGCIQGLTKAIMDLKEAMEYEN